MLGEHGRGSVEFSDLGSDEVPVLMCTLGKAVGTFGAFVAGSTELVETLVQGAREYIYTTALPPAIAAATRAALQVMQDEPWRRAAVLSHAARFRAEAAGLGLRLASSISPIQPLLLGTESAALDASAALRDSGIFVPAIRPPTVPAGTSRLRITFSAAHTDSDLDRLLAIAGRIARPRAASMSLHVEIRGQGPDLVLLHGWALHGGMWGSWLDELATHARLHLVDLPGHGHSPWIPALPSLAELARTVGPIVPPGAALVGWSLGGMIALELARQDPATRKRTGAAGDHAEIRRRRRLAARHGSHGAR